MNLYEQTIASEKIYDGKIIKVFLEDVKLPNDKQSKREIVRHSGAVAVVAKNNEGKFIMVEQFRKAPDTILLEVPAGKLEKGENPKECAVRELEEETGYIVKDVVYLGEILTSPGFCDEKIVIYYAENLQDGNAGGDEDEFINLKTFSYEEILEMILDGRIVDAKTISAFMLYKAKIK